MRKLPPLTELRAFEAAARHLSFKHAAGELGVTPTAISHQIKLLEQHCGRPLFRRRPRPLALTSAGRQLFPVVRDGFGRFAETLSNIKSSHAGRHLRITATNAFAARWLLPRLQSWRAAHPRLKLDIVGTDAVLNLESDETDVAIRYALGPPADGNVVELMRDTFYVVASPKLVDTRATKMRLVDLARLPLIEAALAAGRYTRADVATLAAGGTPLVQTQTCFACEFAVSRGTSRHRGRDRWSRCRDLQRCPGRPRIGERRARSGIAGHSEWLWILHRPSRGCREWSYHKEVHHLGPGRGLIRRYVHGNHRL